MRLLLIISFFALLSINSCTIQKRVHLSGYNVQWHQKISNQKKLAFNEKRTFNEKKNESKIIVEIEKVEIEKTSSYDPHVASNTDSYSSSSKTKTKTLLPNESHPHVEELNNDSKNASPTWNDLLNTSEVQSKNKDTNIPALLSFISACLFIFGITIFFAWLLGIIALKQFEKGRGGSDGKWMATTGFIVSEVLFFALALFSLVAVVFAGPFLLIPAFIFLALAIVGLIIVD